MRSIVAKLSTRRATRSRLAEFGQSRPSASVGAFKPRKWNRLCDAAKHPASRAQRSSGSAGAHGLRPVDRSRRHDIARRCAAVARSCLEVRSTFILIRLPSQPEEGELRAVNCNFGSATRRLWRRCLWPNLRFMLSTHFRVALGINVLSPRTTREGSKTGAKTCQGPRSSKPNPFRLVAQPFVTAVANLATRSGQHLVLSALRQTSGRRGCLSRRPMGKVAEELGPRGRTFMGL
jgi:hypothetical protein